VLGVGLGLPFDAGGGNVVRDPFFSNVKLLGGTATGAALDDSLSARILSAAGAASVGAPDTGPFAGTRALMLPGSGSFYSAPDSPDWAYGAAKVCFQTWVYFASAGVTNAALICQWDGTNGTALYLTGGLLRFRIANAGALQDVQGAWAPSAGVWHHVAGVCDATDATHGAGYVVANGAVIGSSANMKAAAAGDGGPGDAAKAMRLGSLEGFPAFDLTGRLYDPRITVGASRLPIAQPTAPFPRS
jgi:hypothetical protein